MHSLSTIWAQKQALVLGLGESGLAMARWLRGCGAQVRVVDTRQAPQRLAALHEMAAEEGPAVEFQAGEFTADLLQGVDLIAVSPGLAPRLELAQILPAATALGLPVLGEIELFAQALAVLKLGDADTAPYLPKVLAITGTNGKTTVTSMVGLLCRRAGLSVQVAGNISPAALDVLREALQANQLPQVWVLELSSFQLHFTSSLQADAATVLNLSQDHLDWHVDMQEYAQDKARIFAANTVRVLNRDDPTVMRMQAGIAGQPPTVVSFGCHEPQQLDCLGLANERGVQWLSVAVPAEENQEAPKRRKKGDPVLPQELRLKHLMPADALKVRGQHNATNALAALALCRAIDLPFAPLLHALREYKGEPHRVELVRQIADVSWYDDSKGTNVGATVAALNGLGNEVQGRRLVLMAGGVGKDQDFAPLAEPVARFARAVVLFGRDAPQIEQALVSSGVALLHAASLQEAVAMAAAQAQSGDLVLFSPACASFDMFDNYIHRAKMFVAAVNDLACERGELV